MLFLFDVSFGYEGMESVTGKKIARVSEYQIITYPKRVR